MGTLRRVARQSFFKATTHGGNMAMDPKDLVREGRLAEALQTLQDQVRKSPSDGKLRVFLFQMLCVTGEWERAMTQLNVAAELDPSVLLMAQVCRPALNCEALRAEIFAGKRAPLVFGEPEEWVGWMIQANSMAAEGHYGAAKELRDRALEAAPAVPGTINGEPFEWIMDSDSRLGPILEVIIEGRYFWVPFTCIAGIAFEKVEDLRDLVWVPAHFTWANGGAGLGLIPVRYPGSEKAEDAGLRLSRRTEWRELEGELYVALGQRVLATDTGDHALLDIQVISLDTVKGGDEGSEPPEGGDGAPDSTADEGGENA